MTLNLLCEEMRSRAGAWRERRPLVFEALRSWEPDVLGVQEASARQADDVAEALSGYAVATGPNSGPARLPRWLLKRMRLQGELCAIFYRQDRFRLLDQTGFWLSRAPDTPGTALPGTWLPRVVNGVRLESASGRIISVYNAHFDFMPWAPGVSARILRERLDAAWDGAPQIILGDFNATRTSRAFRLLQSSRDGAPPFRDAWQEAERRHGPAKTYHAGTGRERWPGRLDRILFRPDARVELSATETLHRGEIHPSDHFPVLADIDL